MEAADRCIKSKGYEFEIFHIEEEGDWEFYHAFYTLIFTSATIWGILPFLKI